MQIIDTHCHIHDPEYASKYNKPIAQMVDEAKSAGVFPFIVVGTDALSSERAVGFADRFSVYAAVALHPHEVAQKTPQSVNIEFSKISQLVAAANPTSAAPIATPIPDPARIVAIGECGLDYFYHKDAAIQYAQKELLRRHIDLALKYRLPLVFHIRDAFDDFFNVVDDYAKKGSILRGVVHSFSAHTPQMQGCLDRGFYISLNGIMTFTRDDEQLQAARAVPAGKLLVETDAPFLTPRPFRGKMCELNHIIHTIKFLSDLRGEAVEFLAERTTKNAKELFKL